MKVKEDDATFEDHLEELFRAQAVLYVKKFLLMSKINFKGQYFH